MTRRGSTAFVLALMVGGGIVTVSCVRSSSNSGDGSAQDAAGSGDGVTLFDGWASGESGRKDSVTTTPDSVQGLSCASSCHGSASSPAPPVSLKGTSATTERGVGAHQKHLASSTWRATIQCSDCHLVPKAVTEKGHIDTALPAEVTFSTLAKSDSSSPSWSGVTCAGTYCHGSTLSGGTLTSPVWAKVDGTQAACGTCHGLPPTKNHSTSTGCSTCHSAVVDSSKKIIAPSLHIDGKVSATGSHPSGWGAGSVHGPAFMKSPTSCGSCHGSTLTGGSAKSCETCHSGWKTKCTFCHGGTDNTTGAPPAAVDGKTATTVASVGRHTSHVTAGSTHAAYSCSLCHKVPTDALSTGHIDPSPAEVVFSGLAAKASYSTSTYYCTNVYCHGNGKSGSAGSALWIGSLSSGCTACHDDETKGSSMKLSGEHEKHVLEEGYGCSTCHGCVVDSSKKIIAVSKHINGTADVCVTSWNATTKSCAPAGCHGNETW